MTDSKYRLTLMGAFELVGPNDRRIELKRKKAIAVLALLATSKTGERTRAWLQDKLWGSRELGRAQRSLRVELNYLRALTLIDSLPLFYSDRRVVRLYHDNLWCDIIDAATDSSEMDFLEGLSIPSEQAFEEWLLKTRYELCKDSDARAPAPEASPLFDPTAKLDLALNSGANALTVTPFAITMTDDTPYLTLLDQWLSVVHNTAGCVKWFPAKLLEQSEAVCGDVLPHCKDLPSDIEALLALVISRSLSLNSLNAEVVRLRAMLNTLVHNTFGPDPTAANFNIRPLVKAMFPMSAAEMDNIDDTKSSGAALGRL